MRSIHRLDKQLEELVGTERKKADLHRASELSDIELLLHRANEQIAALFELYPRAKERFIQRGLDWYEQKAKNQ